MAHVKFIPRAEKPNAPEVSHIPKSGRAKRWKHCSQLPRWRCSISPSAAQ
jgi:hypothetical protein